MITKVVNVDLHQPIYEKLTAKQGDIASRFILFHLLDGDTPFDLTGKSVRVYARKPDKTEIFNDLIIDDKVKGYCVLELTSQCLAEAGIVKMELYITESGKVLTSIPFDLEVISCINTANSIVSTNEFSALQAALSSLQEYDNYKKEIDEARGGYSSLREKLDVLVSIIVGSINVIDDSLIKTNTTWSSHKINNTISRLQTGFKIPIVTEQPNNPVDGEMWILKSIINDASDVPVLLHNEFNKSGDVNLGAISNLGHKTAIGITPTYSFTLTKIRIRATTRNSSIHNSKMSIKIELCKVVNEKPSTVLETQYVESPSTSETTFAIEATFNSKLTQGNEYCIVLSTTTTSTCYVSLRGTVQNSFDFIYGLNYANSNDTWTWAKYPDQDANFNMYGIKM